jgi:hypothetical protein
VGHVTLFVLGTFFFPMTPKVHFTTYWHPHGRMEAPVITHMTREI